MNDELISRYCRKYPDYEGYEWFIAENGRSSCLKGIDALKAIVPQYEKAINTLNDVLSIISDIERSGNLINDYLQIGEALSQLEIVLEMYNGD